MSSSSYSTIVRFYDSQHVFVTGATGMFGTAYISRLVQSTTVSRVYALARGGEEYVAAFVTYVEHLEIQLPASVIQDLRNSAKIVVFDGDITVPNCGLKSEDLSTVRNKATIFVHAASTINLTWPLSKVAPSIVHGSLIVANLALTCPKLVKFVYISTFSSSTFLQKDANGSLIGADAVLSEDIHQIPNTSCSLDELLGELETSGTTTECKKVQFYNSYSYAKNLTERLLLRKFEQNSTIDKLLIFRPCSVGPAQEHPFPFFELPGCCPVTTFCAVALTMPPVKLGFSSFLKDPTKSTYVEIPVDIAVNRLVAHTAYGTQGCVYAVPKGGQGQSVMKMWDWVSELRPSWLSRPEMVWYAEDWKTDRICPLGRVYGLCGTAFKFEDTKSTQVWEAMSHHERIAWPFWGYNKDEEARYFEGRKKAIESMAAKSISQVLAKGFRL